MVDRGVRCLARKAPHPASCGTDTLVCRPVADESWQCSSTEMYASGFSTAPQDARCFSSTNTDRANATGRQTRVDVAQDIVDMFWLKTSWTGG
jgi:hypothetical protein